MKKINSELKLRYILSLNGLIGIGLTFLFLPNMVKATTVDTTINGQDMLNQNSSLIFNDQSTQTATSDIMPLAITTEIDSGVFGTCNWDIDDEGVLTIHAGVLGEGTGNWVSGVMNDTIKKIVCDPGVVANSSSRRLFYGLKSVETIDVTNLDTSNVTDMDYMFSSAYKTSTSASAVASKNSSLTSIQGLTNLDTSKVTTMEYMFANDSKLDNLDLSSFNTENVTDMSYMFSTDSALSNISGLDKWNTENVQNFTNTFDSIAATNLTEIENWDISSAVKIINMFSGMTKLTSLDLSNWDVSNVTDMGSLFYGCTSLVNVYGLKQWDYHNVTSIASLFYNNIVNQNILDVEGWDTSKITNMRAVFYNCKTLDKIDLSGWDTSNVTDMSYMFAYTSNLTEIKGIDNFNTSKVTDMSLMFYSCNIPILDLSSFNTSKVTNMNSMFTSAKSTNIIGDFDTSSVTTMSSIFSKSVISDFGNIGLNVLDWNVSKCKDFSSAFANNTNLTSLDLSKWDVKSVTTLTNLVTKDTNLQSINVSTWNTPNLTNMSSAFMGDSALETLDLSSFNTSKVTDMSYLVSGASSLRDLDLSNWDTGKATRMGSFFGSNSNLWKISLGPNTKFIITTGNTGSTGTTLPTPPAKNTELIDPNTEEKYFSISDRWQEVNYDGGGTDHEPKGDLFTSSDLNTTTRDANATYVWQQQPYGNVSLDVPDLDYGRVSPDQGITGRQSENWGITITNDVFPNSTVNSKISVSMESPLTSYDGNSTLDDVFVFRGNNGQYETISDTPTQVYDGTVKNGNNVITWDDDHGFLMNMHDSNARMANYSATLDWTMVNSV